MATPTVPVADASWFQPLKAQNKKNTTPSFKGDGVPINTSLDHKAAHGYWLRFNRQKPGGAQLPPSFAFYYTGTGPRGNLKYGEFPPNESKGNSRITWVHVKDADTSIKPKVAKRNPQNPKHALLPLRFPPGDGPAQGFRIDPFQPQRGRGMERGPTQRSQSANPRQNDAGNRRRAASAPGTNRSKTHTHAIPKRTLQKGKTISAVFGKRSPAGSNVGSADTEKAGMADGRIMALARQVPGVQEMLFAGHLSHQFQADAVTLTWTYSITIKSDSSDYDRIKQALDTVVDQTYEAPIKEKKQPAKQQPKQDKPKPQRSPKKQDKDSGKVETPHPDSAQLTWDTSLEDDLESFS
ncbi:nucleocapsid protein [Common moorhen coronavirus HKU21]|uniref:Nucleocapsid protein n=1 Tax=Common moorhen coronavirus HKU21 TaxID=1159902 RepID=H9BR39_9NIDO|nr:nucleocapsid protein [Common moorhen coronavirus HKU21]AFD29248.1 nucleocapsid protein [Common moorhen coronavirus HKU21]